MSVLWDGLVMVGCFSGAGIITKKLVNHLAPWEPYNRYRIKNFFFRLICPPYWCPQHKTCLAFDRWLDISLDRYGVSNIGEYTVEVNGHEIWTANHPYASGRCRQRGNAMCLPLTRRKLLRMRKEYIIGSTYWVQQLNALTPQTSVQITPVKLQDNTLIAPVRTKRRAQITEKNFMKKMIKRIKKRT